jgi:MFS family permease
MIAFRTGNDPGMIDAVFRTSALYREKWEREDYREWTIDTGIEACHGVFHCSVMPHQDFIKFDHKTKEPYVSPPLLAKYIRNNLHYILVRDNARQGILIYVFIKETLKMGDMAELAWGILLSSLGVGAVIGSVIIGVKVKHYRNKFRLFLNILMFDAVSFTLFLINKYFPLSVLLFAFLGVVGSAYMIILNSVLQAAVPDADRGKVFSVLAMLRGPVGVLSVFVGTTAATFITAQSVLLIAAAIEAIIAIGVRLTRAYKEVEEISTAAAESN